MVSDQNNDLQQLRNIIIRYMSRWYVFAITITLCLLMAGGYYISRPKSYNVSAKVMIKTGDDNTGGNQQLDMLQNIGLLGGQRMTEDEIEILRSKTILEHTVRELNIQTIYKAKKGLKWIEAYPTHPIEIIYPQEFTDTAKQVMKLVLTRRATGYKVRMKLNKRRKTYYVDDISQPFETMAGTLRIQENTTIEKGDKFKVQFMPLALWAELYMQTIHVASVKRESNVVRLSTNSDCVRRSTDMLNKMVELYNQDAVEYKNRLALATGSFINDRLALISDELAQVETEVEKYKKDNNLTDIKTESQLFLETATTYQQQMAELETQRNIVTYVRDYIQQTPDELVPANLGIEDPAIVQLVQEYNNAMLTRQRLQRSTTSDNPVVTQLDRQLETTRSNLLVTISSVLQSLQIAHNDAKAKENAFMARIRTMPRQEREYIEIKRQQQVKEALYLFLIQKREENAIALASSLQPARTIDAADYNRTPIAPRAKLLIIIALVAGFILAIIIIIALDLIFNTISNREEFERMLGTQLAGEICTSRSKRNIVVSAGSTSSTAELFRLLRTNVGFMLNGKEHPVILVTSTSTGEGKSFISSNLAASLALTDKRVLLVGLDIRSPQLAEYLSLNNRGHLTEYLAGARYSTDELVFPYTGDERLHVAPAGVIPPNPGELLMSKRLDEAIDKWKQEYDVIIIDSAPVGMVSDTYLLSRFADLTLYVSRIGLTPRSAMDFINEQIKQKKLNNIVCVLNGVPGKARYGSYGYGYGSREDEQ